MRFAIKCGHKIYGPWFLRDKQSRGLKSVGKRFVHLITKWNSFLYSKRVKIYRYYKSNKNKIKFKMTEYLKEIKIKNQKKENIKNVGSYSLLHYVFVKRCSLNHKGVLKTLS